MADRLLITGAAGTFGAHRVRGLRAAGAPLAAMASRAGRAPEDVERRRVGFSDSGKPELAFAGVHTLLLWLPPDPNKRALAKNTAAWR